MTFIPLRDERVAEFEPAHGCLGSYCKQLLAWSDIPALDFKHFIKVTLKDRL